MLSDEQIAQLFRFCEKHLVRHYDVQVELVDHLANAIEAELAANPARSFDQALEKVYAGFGVTGFARIVSGRSEAMSAVYRKSRTQIFWSYFSWPKIAGTLCVFSALLLAIRFVEPWILVYAGNILLVAVYVFEMVVIGKLAKMVKRQFKPLLLTQAIREQSWMGTVTACVLLPQVFNFGEQQISDTGSRIFYTIQLVIAICLFLVSLAYRRVGTKAIADARHDFPEAFAA